MAVSSGSVMPVLPRSATESGSELRVVATTEWLFTVFVDDDQDLGVTWTAAEPDEATPTVACTNTVPRTARCHTFQP